MVTRFGIFEFDPDSGELRREGRPVRLQRQPARMLAALVAQPGVIVTRETLQGAIWGRDTHVDFDRGLNFCAAQIRSALGDSAASPRFIETVPRQGYRFIAPVQERPPELPELPPEGGRYESRSRYRVPSWLPPSGGRRFWAAAILLTAMIAAVAWIARPSRPTVPSVRIAVVPFDNETGVADLDRAAKGVSDATVVRLTTPERLPLFGVIGNAAALRFTFVPRDLQAMGQRLGAQYIVLGQLKRDARGVRIVAHLIRVGDQTHVWAQAFDRPVLDLDTQLDVAEAIAQAVTARVGGA